MNVEASAASHVTTKTRTTNDNTYIPTAHNDRHVTTADGRWQITMTTTSQLWMADGR